MNDSSTGAPTGILTELPAFTPVTEVHAPPNTGTEEGPPRDSAA